jgi:hypothetical protein
MLGANHWACTVVGCASPSPNRPSHGPVPQAASAPGPGERGRGGSREAAALVPRPGGGRRCQLAWRHLAPAPQSSSCRRWWRPTGRERAAAGRLRVPRLARSPAAGVSPPAGSRGRRPGTTATACATPCARRRRRRREQAVRHVGSWYTGVSWPLCCQLPVWCTPHQQAWPGSSLSAGCRRASPAVTNCALCTRRINNRSNS